MNRLLSAAAVAALFALPAAAHAQATAPAAPAATTPAKPMAHHAPVHHMAASGRSPYKYTGYHGGDTPQGNAAVDQLNAQSLANARGGAPAQ